MSRSSASAVVDASIAIPEAYSELKINLDLMTENNHINSLAVISAKRKEGRTSAVIQLAIAYAKSGKKTLVIDADLRNPGVHTPLGVLASPGLSEHLNFKQELAELIQQTSIGRLFVVTAGDKPSNIPELIAADDMELLLAEVSARFDKVIIDCPPLQHIESKILAAKCDGVILIVEYGKINREEAVKVKETLKQVNANLLGTVINKNKGG